MGAEDGAGTTRIHTPGSLPRRSHVRRRGGTNPWYGTDLGFQHALLHGPGGPNAHPEHYGQVSAALADPTARYSHRRILVIEHVGIDIPGRREPAPVRIEFHERPDYDTYGLPAIDYPRVFADPGAISKHRLPADALCLWFPRDPEDRRWNHGDGVVALLNLARNHLFFEDHWRTTGGFGGPGLPEGEWLGDEAPHGFPDLQEAS